MENLVFQAGEGVSRESIRVFFSEREKVVFQVSIRNFSFGRKLVLSSSCKKYIFRLKNCFLGGNYKKFLLWVEKTWLGISFVGCSTISHRISETNSNFHVKWRITERVIMLLCGTSLLVLAKFSFWQGEWALGYHFLEFRQFPNNS